MIKFITHTASANYIVFDLEFATDRDVHERYRQSENYNDEGGARLDRRDPLITPRWPCTRVACASWMTLSVDDEGHLQPTALVSRSLANCDDRTIVANLFAVLYAMGPADVAVSWAGKYHDVTVLQVAAAEYGLRLPTVLETIERYERKPGPRHLDLMKTTCGGAENVHLQEYAARMAIPVKTMCRGNEVWRLCAEKNWARLEAACETDVIVTSMLLGRHLYSHSVTNSTPFAVDMSICNYLRTHKAQQPYAAHYGDHAAKITRDEMIRQAENYAVYATAA